MIGCRASVGLNPKSVSSARIVNKANFIFFSSSPRLTRPQQSALVYTSLFSSHQRPFRHLEPRLNLAYTMGLFSSSRPAPQTIPGDRIIPVSFWDDQDYARGMSLDITLTFNDVLDPVKLRKSLEILLEKKGWEKFGARLRKNVSLAQTST